MTMTTTMELAQVKRCEVKTMVVVVLLLLQTSHKRISVRCLVSAVGD